MQVGNVPSTLRIVDYSHGLTGAAHDASAFEHTAAFRFPDFLFQGQEFAWADSAYPLGERMIPVHRQPASNRHENAIFDKSVSHLCICSEHCMGALKGHFQCLHGLCVAINSPDDHIRATSWITCAIILHNLVIDVEGGVANAELQEMHGQLEEDTGVGNQEDEEDEDENPGHAKQQELVAQLLAYCQSVGIPF